MRYENIDEYYFWTWIDQYPFTGWLHGLLSRIGLCTRDRRDIDERAQRRSR